MCSFFKDARQKGKFLYQHKSNYKIMSLNTHDILNIFQHFTGSFGFVLLVANSALHRHDNDVSPSCSVLSLPTWCMKAEFRVIRSFFMTLVQVVLGPLPCPLQSFGGLFICSPQGSLAVLVFQCPKFSLHFQTVEELSTVVILSWSPCYCTSNA